MNRRAQGTRAERDVEVWLESKGAVILQRNFKRAGGEIDLIARMDGLIAFIEVKQRSTGRYGSPGEAITPKKRARIIQTALHYIQENRLEDERFRFDAALVTPEGIRYIESAFEAE